MFEGLEETPRFTDMMMKSVNKIENFSICVMHFQSLQLEEQKHLLLS